MLTIKYILIFTGYLLITLFLILPFLFETPGGVILGLGNVPFVVYILLIIVASTSTFFLFKRKAWFMRGTVTIFAIAEASIVLQLYKRGEIEYPSDFFLVIFLTAFIFFIIGIVNPQLTLRFRSEEQRTRKFSSLLFGGVGILFFVLFGVFDDGHIRSTSYDAVKIKPEIHISSSTQEVSSIFTGTNIATSSSTTTNTDIIIPPQGFVLPTRLVEDKSIDGWMPLSGQLLEVTYIAPTMTKTLLYNQMTDAIKLSTNGAKTVSMTSYHILIPYDTDVAEFCYIFPEEKDHWLTLYFRKDGTGQDQLLWSMDSFTKDGYLVSGNGKTVMNTATISLAGLTNQKGTFFLALNNKGDKSTNLIFTNFQLLGRDVLLSRTIQTPTCLASQQK